MRCRARLQHLGQLAHEDGGGHRARKLLQLSTVLHDTILIYCDDDDKHDHVLPVKKPLTRGGLRLEYGIEKIPVVARCELAMRLL